MNYQALVDDAMPLDTARRILHPRLPAFATALRSALSEWNGTLAKYHTVLDEFARAVIIGELWYEESTRLLRADQDVRKIKNWSRYCYVVDNLLVLRLKHVDNSYRPWNYPTKRAVAWNWQRTLPGIPSLPRLDLAYRLDITGTVVKDAIIMLNEGHESIWRWQVWGPPVSEFAATPKDQFGRVTFAHDDYSTVTP